MNPALPTHEVPSMRYPSSCSLAAMMLITVAACGGTAEESVAPGGDSGGGAGAQGQDAAPGDDALTDASAAQCAVVYEPSGISLTDDNGNMLEAIADGGATVLEFVASVEAVSTSGGKRAIKLNACSPNMNCVNFRTLELAVTDGVAPPVGAFVRVRAAAEYHGASSRRRMDLQSVKSWNGLDSPDAHAEGYLWLAAGDVWMEPFEGAPFQLKFESIDCQYSYMACGATGFSAMDFSASAGAPPVRVTMGQSADLTLATSQVVRVRNRGSMATGGCTDELHYAYSVSASQ